MSTHPHWARRWLVLLFVALFCVTPLAPALVGADTNLSIGGQAVIANTGGDQVRVRTAPGYDQPVVTTLTEGDVVTVSDGPVTAADGTLWYKVTTSDGSQGYIVQDYLQLPGSGGQTSAADTGGTTAVATTNDAVTPTDQATTNDAVTPPSEAPQQATTDTADVAPPAPTEVVTVVDAPTQVPPTPEVVETPATEPQTPVDVETPASEPQTPAVVETTVTAPQTAAAVETPATEPQTAPDVETQATVAQTPAAVETPATEPQTPATVETAVTESQTPAETGAAPMNANATTPAATDQATATTDTSGTETQAANPTTTTTKPTAQAALGSESTSVSLATLGQSQSGTEATNTSASPEATAVVTEPVTATAEASSTETGSALTATTETGGATPGPTNSENAAVAGTNGTPVAAPATTQTSVQGAATPQALTPAANGTVTSDAAPQLQAMVQPQSAPSDAVAPYGFGTIVGTNGDGVRCRTAANYDSATITVLAESTQVRLTGGVQNGFQAVSCGGQNGFVDVQFIATGGDASSSGAGGSTATGTAVVTGTNGDGLRCRTGAGTSYSIITVLPEGSVVQTRGNAQNGWQPVFCAGQSGWMSSQYLGSESSSSSSGGSSTSGGGSGTGVVSGTNGDGLRCRTAGNLSASTIVVLPEGTTVQLNGSPQNGWQPVICAGQSGWVSNQYLSTSSGSGGGSSGSTSGGGGGSSSGFQAGQTAVVTGTGGSGLNLRSSGSVSSSVLTVMPEGATVTIGSGSTANWIAVTYNGTSGFASATYLTPGSGSGNTSGGSSGSNSGGNTSGGLSVGDHAVTTDNLNLRYSASLSAGVVAVAPSGTVVQITSGLSNGFYGVSWSGLNGYMYGTYLQYTTAALSQRGGSGNPSGGNSSDTGGSAGSGGGTAAGQNIVNYAMQYVGYPYVWAAAGPGAFDCSGFTMWVYQHTLGINITHDMAQQYAGGRPVAYGNLQPGDLVFFQNTYDWGLSHVGIYIGNNQMINALNETAGVVVDDITTQYWQSHWYGAVTYTH